MNRPRLENFKAEFECEGPLSQYMSYAYMLERYCDDLERRLKGEGIDPNPCEWCTDYCYKNDCCKSNGGCGQADYIKKLEEALHKACKELSEFSLCPKGFYEGFKASDNKCGSCGICDFIHENGKCWEEWCFKNE